MFVGFIFIITQLHLRIISLNYTLSRPRQIKIKAKVGATFCYKGQIYMETRDKLMSLTQSDKTQQWLMDKSSNQDDIQQCSNNSVSSLINNIMHF